MALIKCEECGKEISDKAKQCIYCGCPIESGSKIICEECGNELSSSDKVCNKCGCPVEIEEVEEENINLIKCDACGKRISKNAKVCPNCGNPIKKESVFIEKVEFADTISKGTVEIYSDKVIISKYNNTLKKVMGYGNKEKKMEIYFNEVKGIRYREAQNFLNQGYIIFELGSNTDSLEEGNSIVWLKKENQKFERIYKLIMEQYSSNK